MDKYYITTAIAYTSARPHIGNVYEIVLADAIARYKRLLGYDVYFQTGTDEHGHKIELKAQEANVEPQQYVDQIASEVKEEWDTLNTSYDQFVRTTDPIHGKRVQAIFKKLYDQGDIYLGKYEGLYCTPCESFYTESQLINGKCPDCGREVQKTSEEAYFLNLNKYIDRLIEHINNNPDFLQPTARKNEMLNNFIKPGLQDLCVSRTSFKWGIPVSFDDKHVIYVWIDALSNYITFLDYNVDGNSGDKFKKYWPADVHIIGKDIMRFHAIYWPIILLALGEQLPKKILGHPWLLNGNDKMSKSKGNVIYASDLIKHFDIDAIRFYLLNEMNYNNDGVITYDLLIERTNTELANNLGNLINRTINMVNQYNDGTVYDPNNQITVDQTFINLVTSLPKKIEDKLNNLQVSSALHDLFDIFRAANKYIEDTTPWIVAKDETQKERLNTILYNLLECIRVGAVLLQPFLPDTAEKIFKQLNTGAKSWQTLHDFNKNKFINKVNKPEPLFIRIDKAEKLKALNN